jgi:NADH:ubiquinone oxidoreductase subunit H
VSISRFLKRGVVGVIAAAIAFAPVAASACTVCFGDPSSSLNKGASNGIFFMLAVIGLVQIGFIALFWSFWRRAKALRARREEFQLIDGGLQ